MQNEIKSKVPVGQSGGWKVEKFTVPKSDFEALKLSMEGRPVPPGDYTRLMYRNETVMSDTPAEIRDLIPLIWRAEQQPKARILVNGLGLGLVAQMLVDLGNVISVDVVEKSADVIKLVGPSFKGTKIHIHQGDALSFEWSTLVKWDLAWHDIWTNMPNEDDKPTITRLKRKYGRRVRWQGVWCEGVSRY